MTFIANKSNRFCFAACPSNVVKAGQCACENRYVENNKKWNDKIKTLKPKSEKS